MNFDKLEHTIRRFREATAEARKCRDELRALGIDGFPGPADLPGDAPNPHVPALQREIEELKSQREAERRQTQRKLERQSEEITRLSGLVSSLRGMLRKGVPNLVEEGEEASGPATSAAVSRDPAAWTESRTYARFAVGADGAGVQPEAEVAAEEGVQRSAHGVPLRPGEGAGSGGVSDAPNPSKSSNGSMPWRPSWEMTGAACNALSDGGFQVPDATIVAALSAAAAVAPKAEVPEVTQSDVEEGVEAWHRQTGPLDEVVHHVLRTFRESLVARMEGKP